MLTLNADAWSSVAVDPHDQLMDADTLDEMPTRLLFLVQMHDCKSVTASGHLS